MIEKKGRMKMEREMEIERNKNQMSSENRWLEGRREREINGEIGSGGQWQDFTHLIFFGINIWPLLSLNLFHTIIYLFI